MRNNITVSAIVVLCSLLSIASAADWMNEQGWREYSPDTIIVKLREDVSVNFPDDLEPSRQNLQSVLPFNRIHGNNRAVHIRPLFRDFKNNQRRMEVLLSKEESGLNRKEKRLRQRFQRAPKNATAVDLGRIYRVEIDPEEGDVSFQKILAAYQNSPYIEYAEPDYYVRLCRIPNDPNYPQQWALKRIDAPEAWDIHTGSHDVVVAVIDTGIDLTHPDFQGNIWTNELELNGLDGVDDDENGYIDDVHGYDFAYDDGEPLDDMSHGSHVAGIIAARGNNRTDVSGICWNATIMPVKAIDPDTLGPASNISEAIYYAVVNGADILSCSWGMNPPSDLLEDAFQYAYHQGVVAVAAVGNDNTNSVFYPAGYTTVISVGASTQSDQRAFFSNYGNWVDLMAPGVNILSLSYYGMTRTWEGTSMACPHVSGACALMLSVNPYLKPDEIRQIVMASGDPVASGMCRSGKRVNLFNALNAVVSSSGAVHFDEDFYSGTGTLSVSVTDADLKGSGACEVVLTTDNNDVETITLTEGTPGIGVFQGTIAMDIDAPIQEDGLLQVIDGENITATYLDLRGTGRNWNRERTITDMAMIDGQAPTISYLEVDASSPQPTVIIQTDEPAIATVQYGLAGSETNAFNECRATMYTTRHTIVLNEVVAQTDYTFVIEVTDRLGNTSRDDNDGALYGFTTIADVGNIYIPADCNTIQEAIDQCWNGNTVWVADGTYTGPGNRDINFKGKAITVRSENGPDVCIIDCRGSEQELHRGFYFHHRETPNSVLDGLTITGGFQEGQYSDGKVCRGGGILCNASSPTIKNCVLRNNSATYGGGLHSYNGSNVTLINCVFADNTAQRGAGVNNDESTLEAIDCLFNGNVAASYYGGLYSGYQNSQITLTRCIFRENSAFFGAGAVGIGGQSATITHCEFVGNTAIGRDSSRGGAIRTSGGVITIRNSIFSGNKSREFSGALYQYRGQVDLINCTFSGNTALDGRAAAVFAYDDDSTVLWARNCIFWDGGLELFGDESAQLDIGYSNIQGNYPGDGNINEDPLFVDTGFWDEFGTPDDPNDDIWLDGDYHLQSQAGYWNPDSQSWLKASVSSPCIDTGDPNSTVGQEPVPNGGRINMGVYGGTDQASLSSN